MYSVALDIHTHGSRSQDIIIQPNIYVTKFSGLRLTTYNDKKSSEL
jgi:hypothetical protein